MTTGNRHNVNGYNANRYNTNRYNSYRHDAYRHNAKGYNVKRCNTNRYNDNKDHVNRKAEGRKSGRHAGAHRFWYSLICISSLMQNMSGVQEAVMAVWAIATLFLLMRMWVRCVSVF